jgi:RNA polymerase sigma-70 factor (ECF subfamily)
MLEPARRDPALRTAHSNGQDGFVETYKQYYPRLFAYIYARVGNTHQSEDIVSDVFERVYLKLDSLRDRDALATWLFTIARNAIVSHVRKRSRETIVDHDVMSELSPATASVESEVMHREDLAGIARAVRTFSRREQDIVSLKFDAELTNAQIAQIMGLTEQNVRVIIFRTIRKLRKIMAAQRTA